MDMASGVGTTKSECAEHAAQSKVQGAEDTAIEAKCSVFCIAFSSLDSSSLLAGVALGSYYLAQTAPFSNDQALLSNSQLP